MTTLVELALATWRVTALFVHERGPYAIFTRIRGSRPVETHVIGFDGDAESELGRLFSCSWCFSIWAAAVVMVLSRVAPSLVRALAVSAAAILVESITQGERDGTV